MSNNRLSGSPGMACEDIPSAPDKATAHGSDAKQRSAVISRVSFVLGVVWILLFPLVTVTTGEAKPRGTYFDENAMLVHHTLVKVQPSNAAWSLPGQLRTAHPQVHAGGATWLCDLFRSMELPCYSHAYYETPSQRVGLRKSLYTVLEPAPGADGKECIVVTTAQDLSGSAEQLLDNSAFTGLTVSLSILKELQHHVGWMSKRLVLLVVDSDEEGGENESFHVGVKAFVDDYHLNTLDLVERQEKDPNMTGSLRHGGVVRAALSLDLAGPCIPDSVQLLAAGLNGELPNMDLVTASVHHFEVQQINVALDGFTSNVPGEPFGLPHARALAASAVSHLHVPNGARGAVGSYLERLFGMLGFMGSMVIGPSGPHTHFLQHSVDALTVRGRGRNGREGKCSRSPVRTTAALLSIIRGISNLEEELHHSFFAYVMLSTEAFVSIGEYAYALALLLVPLLMEARGLVGFNKDKGLLRAVLLVGVFELYGVLLLLSASASTKLSAESIPHYLAGATLGGYVLLMTVRSSMRRHGVTCSWEGPKMVMACLAGYSYALTALRSWPLATLLALSHVPMLVTIRPFKASSLLSWCALLSMLTSLPLIWSPFLTWATPSRSGGAVILGWIRWYQRSGLLNAPLLCLISIPAHLTATFVLLSPTAKDIEK